MYFIVTGTEILQRQEGKEEMRKLGYLTSRMALTQEFCSLKYGILGKVACINWTLLKVTCCLCININIITLCFDITLTKDFYLLFALLVTNLINILLVLVVKHNTFLYLIYILIFKLNIYP